MDAAVQLGKETPAVPVAPTAEARKDLKEHFGWLPCQLSLEIPIVRFTVGDLLRLGPESIVETACPSTSDIPLRANGLLIAWTEFEVIGNRLALRITELA
jgi:flagellar motor switch/type III secretory pathway protein FliN